MKKIIIIISTVLIIDLILGYLLIYSGLILPYINPSLENYNEMITSFPRNYTQIILWYIIHFPLCMITFIIGDKFALLLVLQDIPLILLIIFIKRKIVKIIKKNPSDKQPVRGYAEYRFTQSFGTVSAKCTFKQR